MLVFLPPGNPRSPRQNMFVHPQLYPTPAACVRGIMAQHVRAAIAWFVGVVQAVRGRRGRAM